MAMATMTKVEDVLDVLAHNFPDLLAAAGLQADSCVRGTRVACLALGEVGIKASPVAVQFSGYSPRYVEAVKARELPDGVLDGTETPSPAVMARLVAEGAWNVQIGHPGTPPAPNRWPGHLVALVERRWLLDATLHQASRPAKKMHWTPQVIRATPGFMAGEPVSFTQGGSVGLYRRIENNTYLVSPDWAGVSRDDSMVRHAVRLIR